MTTNNSTDRCRTNCEASLVNVSKNIRPACSWVEHSNCDISPSCRLLPAVSPPVWAYAYSSTVARPKPGHNSKEPVAMWIVPNLTTGSVVALRLVPNYGFIPNLTTVSITTV
ncbi:hypothetical protein PoB_004742100 [Plakobranchus ocellatus]|uniref:Uncharacterized protein n=1 Tax=Plakobranchus ocellatus TaxID=259542 RepID=A0AAV4BKJ6_9GAST|nr:hypothetical protein PoB_004742100 [Plakobranchus ocellatus]